MIKYINYINKKHKRGGFFKGICLFLFCIMLTICSLPLETLAKNSDKASVMRIEEAVGTVKINASNASSGMQLYSGDTVSTEAASYSHISLDASKLIKLSQKSQASISKAGKKLEISLVSGEIFFDVKKKLSGDESMTMKSSSVSMSVRGTSGIIRNYGDSIKVSLYDGVLDVSCPSGSFAMWGGESVVFNSDGTIQHRDLVDVKRMSEFEDQVIATDGDVINRASANMNVGLPVARYNARSAGQNIEENIQQIVVPVVESKPVEQPAQPVTPKPEEKKNVTPPSSSSSSHSSDHHDSSDNDHSGGGSGGGSDGGDDPKPNPEPTPDPTPDPEPTCEHNWEYQNKVENHIKTCTKCGQTETENHTPTYSKMERYPELHLETCSLCGYDNGVEHTFNIEGHFDKDGNTTEDTNEYYTRKCICDTVDLSSKKDDSSQKPNPETCEHEYKYENDYDNDDNHIKVCIKCGKNTHEKHDIQYWNDPNKSSIHFGACKYCTLEIKANHIYDIRGIFDKDGNETDNLDEYYNLKCVCGLVEKFNQTIEYCNEDEHMITSYPSGKVTYELHEWGFTGMSENHKICKVCSYYPIKCSDSDFKMGYYSASGFEVSKEEAFYTLKCEICGTLDGAIYSDSIFGDPSCNHEYIYLYAINNSGFSTSCDKVCKHCHYLEGTYKHEYVNGLYSAIVGDNKEFLYTQKCSNCGYENPYSVLTKIY